MKSFLINYTYEEAHSPLDNDSPVWSHLPRYIAISWRGIRKTAFIVAFSRPVCGDTFVILSLVAFLSPCLWWHFCHPACVWWPRHYVIKLGLTSRVHRAKKTIQCKFGLNNFQQMTSVCQLKSKPVWRKFISNLPTNTSTVAFIYQVYSFYWGFNEPMRFEFLNCTWCISCRRALK